VKQEHRLLQSTRQPTLELSMKRALSHLEDLMLISQTLAQGSFESAISATSPRKAFSPPEIIRCSPAIRASGQQAATSSAAPSPFLPLEFGSLPRHVNVVLVHLEHPLLVC
jgi:hypothetical protein